MKQLLSILSLLLFVSCNDVYDHLESDIVLGTGDKDPSLSVYLERFEKDMNVEIPYFLSINVVDTLYKVDNPNVDAVCWSNTLTGTGEKIEIKRSRWNVLSEAGKEQLLYHELGHCVLNKGHVLGNKIVKYATCPVSIMNPYTFSEFQIEECYIPDHLTYLTELRL